MRHGMDQNIHRTPFKHITYFLALSMFLIVTSLSREKTCADKSYKEIERERQRSFEAKTKKEIRRT